MDFPLVYAAARGDRARRLRFQGDRCGGCRRQEAQKEHARMCGGWQQEAGSGVSMTGAGGAGVRGSKKQAQA
jgi:hypothetical protein